MTTNKELRELAEKATPGKWDLSVHTNPVGSFDAKRDDWTISVGGTRIVAMEDGFRNASDVRFIAAANPATVLALLNNIEALQAECDALREALVEARDLVAKWGDYASDYFKEMYGLERDIARLDAALSGLPGSLPMEPYQTVDRGSPHYKAGWNACRRAMLAALEKMIGGPNP